MLTGSAARPGEGPSGSRSDAPRRAAVVGLPVRHSLSPVLHRAAYAALGLTGWTYGRTEVGQGQLAEHLRSLGPEWVGLSVTMPGKEEALALADQVGPGASLAGAANTLVRRGGGWYAENTDVPGLATALQTELGGGGADPLERALVLGGGATARSAVLALGRLGVREITLLVRDRLRPETERMLDRLAAGTDPPVVRVGRLADGIPLDRQRAQVVVSTLPGDAPAPAVDTARTSAGPAVLLDVAYAPWPSALAQAVAAASGGRVAVVRGTAMLLHQAAVQVELMTGRAAPVEAMEQALQSHLGTGR